MPAPVVAISDAAALLPPRGSLLGLDIGTKTIGVATSDAERRLATGVETIARKTFTADAAATGVLDSAGRASARAHVITTPRHERRRVDVRVGMKPLTMPAREPRPRTEPSRH